MEKTKTGWEGIRGYSGSLPRILCERVSTTGWLVVTDWDVSISWSSISVSRAYLRARNECDANLAPGLRNVLLLDHQDSKAMLTIQRACLCLPARVGQRRQTKRVMLKRETRAKASSAAVH